MYFFFIFFIILTGDDMKNEKINLKIKSNKYKYLFLLILIILGIISGIIFSNILSFNDKKDISLTIASYLEHLKNNDQINYIKNLIESLKNNFLYLILIVIFSLSVIGVILNPIILYFKSFIIGFNIGIMITIYSFKGIILGIFSVFPHQFINLLIYLFISFNGINLSIKLFKFIFFKKQYNFTIIIKKYFNMIAVSCIILVLTSLYETFLGDFLLKVFTFLLK